MTDQKLSKGTQGNYLNLHYVFFFLLTKSPPVKSFCFEYEEISLQVVTSFQHVVKLVELGISEFKIPSKIPCHFILKKCASYTS